tara:strand:+ start:2700 stop:3062 length:363 start_codon:yes stop_codon:yes gene_type:complete
MKKYIRKFSFQECTILQMLVEYAYAKEVDNHLLTYWNPDQINEIAFWKDIKFAEEICHDFYNWVNTSTANEPKYNPERDSFDPLKVKEGRSELIEQLDDFVDQYQLNIKYQERRNTNAHT